MASHRRNLPPYDQVAELLISGRLSEACAFLSLAFAKWSAYQGVDDCKRLQEDYDRLLSYFAQGVADPHRAEMLDSLMERAWHLADQLDDYQHPAPAMTIESNLISTLEQLPNFPDNESYLGYAFEYVATSHYLLKEERNAVHRFILSDEESQDYTRATMLGAVTLYTMQRFDAEMIENLYIYTLDDQPVQIQMQAWVALVFVAIIHHQRIKHHPRLREQFRLMAESEPELLLQIQIALLQCREAFNFDKKLHDIVNTDGDAESIAQENVKDFLAYISEGIDMSLSTFERMKDLPFFSGENSLHHWLEPFSLQHPLVKHILEQNPDSEAWTKILMQSAAQCETDKYGAFITMHLANNKLMSMLSKKLEESGLDPHKVMPLPPVCVMRNYLHDLFRYCHLHPQGKAMRFKPFEQTLNLSLNPWLRYAFEQRKPLEKIAEFLFRKERWNEAIVAYLELLKVDNTLKNMQRLIYSAMQAADPSNGVDIVEYLVKCNALHPRDRWTLKNLADLLHAQGSYDSEEMYLHEALTHFPKDVGILMRLGRCLNCLGQADRGLDYLFEADLKKEGLLNVQRELARGLLLIRRPADAEHYIRIVLSRPTPTSEDWLLAGHIALAAGDCLLAIDRYMHVNRKLVEQNLTSTMAHHPLNQVLVETYGRQLTLSLLQQKWQEQDYNSEINN